MAKEPIPSATILMLRDGADGLETFMVVRHHQIDFASGALVFPGGKVDARDAEAIPRCFGAATDDAAALAIHIAAIREAFEECGILLAREGRQDNGPLLDGSRLATLEAWRPKLAAGEVSMMEFLEAEDLSLAADLLVPFAHWITPTMMPKRFDTHFFLAAAPADHVAAHDGEESVDSVWISPARALTDAEAGSRTIIFPTRMNIELLGRSGSVAAALRDTRERDIVTVLPWTEQRDDGTWLCIPPQAGYAVSEELMAAPGKAQ